MESGRTADNPRDKAMALFGKDRERDDRPRASAPATTASAPATTVSAPEPAPREVEMFDRDQKPTRPEDLGATSAFLGKGTKIVGKLSFEGSVRIEGQIEGEIAAQDTLTIGESAVVKAKVTGTSVIVHGQVTGDIQARTRLELRAPSKVVGNINSGSLVIHEGAVFEGQCSMGGGAEAARKGNKKPDFSVLFRDGADSAEEPVPPPTPPARN